MHRIISIIGCVLLLVAASASADPIMGNWEGAAEAKGWENTALAAKIIGMPDNAYRILFEVDGTRAKGELQGKQDNKTAAISGEITLEGKLAGVYAVSGRIADGVFSGTLKPAKGEAGEEAAFEMKQVRKIPPTLNAAPPEGAIVLFDGTNLDAWNYGMIQDGRIVIGGGQFYSKQEFGSAEIHVEFCTPYMPWLGGQARGNSGVYLAGRYEIQVLDSFGDEPADNLCGGIYQLATPKVNACLPPDEWQTYDITFHAPQFDAQGKKTKDALISVRHNGVLIHDNVVLPHVTPGGVSPDEAPVGPLHLQNHGDPVQYKNIWVKPLDK